MNANDVRWYRRVAAGLVLVVAVALAPKVALAQEDASSLEAFIETSKGSITIRFHPKEAPKHVAHFIATARAGGFDGTTFHRAIPYAIVQGGDPLSKDPKKKALYGTGGMKLLPDEPSSLKHLAGAVSAVMLVDASGAPVSGSSGTQFFICDTWQQQLDGKFSVFAWVVDGMDVVRQISALPRVGDKIEERVVISKVTIRPVTPTREEIGTLRVRMDTTAGEMVWDLLPTAPENARNFVRLARAGYYDGATIYRAIAGLLIQGAAADGWPADSPNRKRSFAIWNVPDEFTADVPFERGIVGMAHSAAENSANVHFFVLVSRAANLDAKYTPFARVVSGIEVADAMSKQPATGEKLASPVTIRKVTIEKR